MLGSVNSKGDDASHFYKPTTGVLAGVTNKFKGRCIYIMFWCPETEFIYKHQCLQVCQIVACPSISDQLLIIYNTLKGAL